MLAVLVPVAVLARVAAADWISAVVIAVTLPLIPVFAVLVGWHTRARTRRQWRLLARLGGHFLDVVEGLPTLKVFGRAKAQDQVIAEVTDDYRSATMATLRVAFLSALVLELAAAVATALVAVEVGLRLLYGHMGYETALLVLLLTPEAYLPLRAVGAAVPREHGRRRRGRARLRDPGRPRTRRRRTSGPGAGRRGRSRRAAQRRPADARDQAERGHRGLSGPASARPGRGEPDDPARATGSWSPGRAVRARARCSPCCCGSSGRPPGPSAAGAARDLAAIDLTAVARPDRLGAAAALPVRRHRGGQHRAGPGRRQPQRHRAGRPAGRSRRIHRGPARPATTRRSASAACGCPRASGSGSRWLARSCGTRPCCSWTSPPPTWIRPVPG